MTLTVALAFDEFAAKLIPTPTQKATIAGRRDRVEKFLSEKYGPDSNMPVQQVAVIGSAARATLIRPINDVDAFAVFDDRKVWSDYQFDSKKLLYRVREALTGLKVETVGSRGQAVRLFYNQDPHVDITPAFPWYVSGRSGMDGYVIPRGDGGWQRTDPFRQNELLAARHRALNGRLRPLVRLLKRWNSVHSSRIGSFHLERVVQATFSQLGGDVGDSIYKFFLWGANHLHVDDGPGHSPDLAAGFTTNQEQAIKQGFLNASIQAQRALSAEIEGEVPEALRQWKIVFGDEFPSYG